MDHANGHLALLKNFQTSIAAIIGYGWTHGRLLAATAYHHKKRRSTELSLE
jgi:hypothetical protein